MIETFFGADALGSPQAFFASFIIGLLFGLFLERAGFGSSRRLAGIFYFRDMAVLKVMFSALITAMLGLSYLLSTGMIPADQLYFMPSVYGAQIVGGLLFGVGFAMSGWCPGTGAVGLASGRIDALVFLVGTVLGSILFNELYGPLKGLYSLGDGGVRFVYDSLGMSRSLFAFLFTAVAVLAFWGSEYIEKRFAEGGGYLNSRFLKSYSLALLILAGGLSILPPAPTAAVAVQSSPSTRSAGGFSEKDLLAAVESAEDHIDPIELADRLMSGERGLTLIDVRTPAEYEAFHIRDAVNVPISGLPDYLAQIKEPGVIVLYSNGMTHPAQARDALQRMGYRNVYILTDGLKGFVETCLKPASLRSEPVPGETASRIAAWRSYFYASKASDAAPRVSPEPGNAIRLTDAPLPGLIETRGLADNLGGKGLKILDVRSQPEYNSGHIPGSIYISVESFRGVVGGVPSMLLPAGMLALHFSGMGIEPSDTVVVVYGERPMDATLAVMAFERLGHRKVGILNGGFLKWAREKLPVDTALPVVSASKYPVNPMADDFSIDYRGVLDLMKREGTVIIDVRPADYFSGKKSDEARAGHIPGAVNRPFSEDIVKTDDFTAFKPPSELATAYAAIIPSKDSTVIVHCRTGHQASQTFFVLKRLLGYRNVLWYDAGWTEWSARPDLPVVTGP